METIEQWAERLRAAYMNAPGPSSGDAWSGVARLVLADCAALEANLKQSNVEVEAQRNSLAEVLGHLRPHSWSFMLAEVRGLKQARDRIRGSGGVLTREECAATMRPFWSDGVVPGASVRDGEAVACAQHARDVAVVRAHAKRYQSPTTPTPAEWEALLFDLGSPEERAPSLGAAEELVAARAEVERLKAARPTPPADLDGYMDIYDEVWRTKTRIDAVTAVIAARDAWWEERLTSEVAVRAAAETDAAGTRWFALVAIRAAIAAVRAGAAPAPAQPAEEVPTTGLAIGLADGRRLGAARCADDLASALGAPPGESWDALLGRVRAVCDVDPASLAAFRRDVAELVGRVYEADGRAREVASHDVILDRIRELVATERDEEESLLRRADDVSKALGLQTRAHSWGDLLGRVRGMVDEHASRGKQRDELVAEFAAIDASLTEAESARGRNFIQKTLVERVKALAEYGAEVDHAEKPPTLHLTAEDREALGQAVWHGAVSGRGIWSALHEDTREGWRTSAAHIFTLGVEAAFAAVQSEEACGYPMPVNVRDAVTAARGIVKVPAKKEPAPVLGREVPEVPASVDVTAAAGELGDNITRVVVDITRHLVALDAALRAREVRS